MDFNLRKVQNTVYVDNDMLTFVYSGNGNYTIKTKDFISENSTNNRLQNIIDYLKTISKTILENDNKTS